MPRSRYSGLVSDARKATTSATSSGVPARPSSGACASRSIVAGSCIGVAMGPGSTAFTLMPNSANSRAAVRVSPRAAHFDAV